MENWKTFRLRFMNRNLLILFISAFVFSLCALSSTIKSKTDVEIRHPLTGTTDFYLQKLEKAQDIEMNIEEINEGMMTSRKLLGGPGSWPPQCTSKCGRCTPCRPVHVPVPPGTPVTAEYYPEAWRCKCGNRLYLP